MDVIIGHDVPTAASATKTNSSSTSTSTSTCAKLCNGTVVGAAETVKEVVTGGAAPAGAGRKKTKRKNRAKNSQREETTADDTATAVEGSVLTTTTIPSSSATAAGDVNSSNHNDRSSHGSNGLPDPQPEDAVDAISKKLEQCVHVGRNGLTNGLPKLDRKDSNIDACGSGHTVATPDEQGPPKRATAGTMSTGATSKKSKQRARQQKKAQQDASNCTALPNGTAGADGSEAEQPSSRSGASNTAFSGISMEANGKLDAASASTVSMVQENARKVVQQEQQPSTNVDPVTAQSPACSAASTSSLPKATTEAAGSSEIDNGLQKEMLVVASTVPVAAAADITYQVYESERQMPAIMALIQKDLSEPYSIYTYRYFIHNWPKLCFLAQHNGTCVGAIVCKLDIHRENIRRGYIAMLAVDKDYRKLKIGTTLVQKAIQVMLDDKADEVVLETEITNQPALRLYENLGFVRDKRLFHYYLNGVDALRLKLWFR
ncbi:N-alpha-acetyltransferase 30-like [Anopheles albimanus]|uniref:N-terminal methionine N(alpha)-acetyltransferase NatC n=1 Tax=Anopheles albimanus TaxID=7167 RepID=A0A182FNQ6_ANOAL|nr:N-alpha-acetyltransferase 30-like [Anopheles albimanus]